MRREHRTMRLGPGVSAQHVIATSERAVNFGAPALHAALWRGPRTGVPLIKKLPGAKRLGKSRFLLRGRGSGGRALD